MVLDYSKFDNIELSDDSDIEVHPNIDKKSFIRWKQRDIHQKREQAKERIEQYRIEIEIHHELINRLDQMTSTLKLRKSDAPSEVISGVMQSYPEESEDRSRNRYTYKEMMENLLQKVDQEVKAIRDEDKGASIAHKLSMHRDKLLSEITSREQQIRQLEQENARKITSDGLHEGFNYSSIAKPVAEEPIKESILKTLPQKGKKDKGKVQAIEVLNPNARPEDIEKSTNTEAGYETDSDADIDADDLPERIEPTPIGRQFGEIAIGNHDESLRFLSKHPGILRDETETDGLLIDAYYAEIKLDHTKAKRNIHQGLLLQYCRQLGKDGVNMFFHRIKDKKHRAFQLFMDDVDRTYARIQEKAVIARAEEEAIAKEGAKEPVEQIQLHAVDPNTKIGINVPPANHDDPRIQECRKIYESFSPNLQKALASNDLAEINKVLGKMQVEEAEEIVELLSKGGMLAIEDKILDATDPSFVMPDRLHHRENSDAEDAATEEAIDQSSMPSTATQSYVSAVDDLD